VSRQSFKEDFEAWRASLTPEERGLLQEQAMGEFNKNYRKSDNFKKDLPEEKMKAFGTILSKFFENESEDYKKAKKAVVPDYEGLFKVAGDKYTIDFSLTNRVTEVDREADRRYNYVSRKIWEYESKGEKWPQSAPVQEYWEIQNNDTDSHANAELLMEFVKTSMDDPNCPADTKAALQKVVDEVKVPPVGEEFRLLVPEHMAQQILTLRVWIIQDLYKKKEMIEAGTYTEEEYKKFDAEMPKVFADMALWMQENFYKTQEEVADGAAWQKAFFRSQKDKEKDFKGKTKADVMKEIWAMLPSDKPKPPLDDEMLAELAEEPAIAEGEWMHSWGTADVLYKSEAIDSFGEQFLLGVYETKEEATAAFAEWNIVYEAAREKRDGEMDVWLKQEWARVEAQKGPGTERVTEMLEEARR
jgi:hypothetical protein